MINTFPKKSFKPFGVSGMFLNKWGISLNKLYHSLAFRLTLWYALIYTGSIIVVFLILYIFISSFLGKRIDAQLSSDLLEFQRIYNSKGLDGIREEIILESESEGVKQVFFLCMIRMAKC